MELHITKANLLALLRKQLAAAERFDASRNKWLADAEAKWLRAAKKEVVELARVFREAKTADEIARSRVGNGRDRDGEMRYLRIHIDERPPAVPRLAVPKISRAIALIEADERESYRLRDYGKDHLIYWAATWTPESELGL